MRKLSMVFVFLFSLSFPTEALWFLNFECMCKIVVGYLALFSGVKNIRANQNHNVDLICKDQTAKAPRPSWNVKVKIEDGKGIPRLNKDASVVDVDYHCNAEDKWYSGLSCAQKWSHHEEVLKTCEELLCIDGQTKRETNMYRIDHGLPPVEERLLMDVNGTEVEACIFKRGMQSAYQMPGDDIVSKKRKPY